MFTQLESGCVPEVWERGSLRLRRERAVELSPAKFATAFFLFPATSPNPSPPQHSCLVLPARRSDSPRHRPNAKPEAAPARKPSLSQSLRPLDRTIPTT